MFCTLFAVWPARLWRCWKKDCEHIEGANNFVKQTCPVLIRQREHADPAVPRRGPALTEIKVGYANISPLDCRRAYYSYRFDRFI